MKRLFFFLFFLQNFLQAQVVEFTLLDASTKLPIGNAEAYYTLSLNGTISNNEGKMRVNIENDTLVLSHIGYETKKILLTKPLLKQPSISILKKYNLKRWYYIIST